MYSQPVASFQDSTCSFFFSSRRRHTIWPRDWSSDVCSSDLVVAGSPATTPPPAGRTPRPDARSCPARAARPTREIGRASCRERVELSVVLCAYRKLGVLADTRETLINVFRGDFAHLSRF